MTTRRFFSFAALAGLALSVGVPAVAEDKSVADRLDQEGLKYEVDTDGDYKVTLNYEDEGRTQLVFVSGKTEAVSGLTIREVFSPAARVETDSIDGDKALKLLEESSAIKVGSWELRGGVIYFVAKVLDSITATELNSLLNIVAGRADDKEIELSGDRDEL